MQEEWKQSVSERRYWDERKDRKLCLGCKTNKLLNFKKKKIIILYKLYVLMII